MELPIFPKCQIFSKEDLKRNNTIKMSLRKLTDSIGVKTSGVFIMALQSDILDGRYGSIESRYLAKCFSKVSYLTQ